MSDKIIKCIMERKALEPPKFSIRKVLKKYDMEMYEKICLERIIEEIGVDSVDIVFDFANNDIGLTHRGIKKCEPVLLSYLNSDQRAKISELIETEEELAININNLLWRLQRKSKKQLKEILKESGTEEEYRETRDKIHAELRSRSVWNKVRLLLEERCCDIIARVKYHKFFKIIGDVVEKYESDSAYQPHLEREDRPAIIHSNYLKYRDISPQKRSREEIIKYVFYGMLDLKRRESKFAVRVKECFEIEERYNAMRDIIEAAAGLTPGDFLNMFPVDKEYYGEKHGFKDYFYTMKNLDKFPMDEKIGDMIVPFLDIYYSKPVFLFWVNYVNCVDDYALYCGVNEPSEEYYNGMKRYWQQEVQESGGQ